MSQGGIPAPRPLGAILPPGPWESMGRGVQDVLDVLNQTLYSATDKQKVAVYRALRAENERLYQRGLRAGMPGGTMQQAGYPPGYPYPPGAIPAVGKAANEPPTPDDPWRAVGKYGLLNTAALGLMPASITTIPGEIMSLGLTQDAYSALLGLAQKFGITD